MLTCIVPSYNHERYIELCLSALLKLESATRILVIDDGSTDQSVPIIQAFISRVEDPRLELVVKPNQGLVSSLNLGLKMSETEFVYIVASDDIADPDGLDSLVQQLLEKPHVAFAIGGGTNFSEESSITSPVYRSAHRSFFRLPKSELEKAVFLDYPSPVLLQGSVFRRSILMDVGGWDSDLELDDYPMFAKILKRSDESGKGFLFLPDINVVNYRSHSSNAHRNLLRLYGMNIACVVRLCPQQWKTRALANLLAFYTLMAVRAGKYKVAATMMTRSDPSVRLWSLPRMVVLLFRKLMGTL